MSTQPTTLNWFGGAEPRKAAPSRRPRRNSIKFPIFVKFAGETQDQFWKDILDGMARGKFPPNVQMSRKEPVLINKKDRKKALSLDSGLVVDELIEFLRDNCSLYSEEDKQLMKHMNSVLEKPKRSTRYYRLPYLSRRYVFDWAAENGVTDRCLLENMSAEVTSVVLSMGSVRRKKAITFAENGSIQDIDGITLTTQGMKFDDALPDDARLSSFSYRDALCILSNNPKFPNNRKVGERFAKELKENILLGTGL